ncbi:hypothetical protein SMI01S_36030 [Sphingobacterium mizutaii NBRC 14946 = DSM 11724]|uniref:Uncharacterized protein n=1 Tax=Sphingobacterium mizutaii NBRC 14946 = DSM 11724 TaxID=1220576 RepID=A0ABQ0W7T1_9SPHI|nr:hypothetical protein SMI01S_36030 [Sphingobacterium mizutaii NBRC 14946 = DSM 11724]
MYIGNHLIGIGDKVKDPTPDQSILLGIDRLEKQAKQKEKQKGLAREHVWNASKIFAVHNN